MESALARIADGGAAAERATAEETAAIEPIGTKTATPVDTAESRYSYIADIYGIIDDIENLFPEVVRILRERIADLEKFLAQSENPYIQHGAIAATNEVVQAVHRIIKRTANTHSSEAPES